MRFHIALPSQFNSVATEVVIHWFEVFEWMQQDCMTCVGTVMTDGRVVNRDRIFRNAASVSEHVKLIRTFDTQVFSVLFVSDFLRSLLVSALEALPQPLGVLVSGSPTFSITGHDKSRVQ